MRLVILRAGEGTAEQAVGGLVCRDVPDPRPGHGALFRKGATFSSTDLERLASLRGVEVRVLVPEAGEVAETAAAARLAAAVAGDGLRADPPVHGQATLRAVRRGWLLVNRSQLEAINQLDGVLVFTAHDERPTEPDVAVGAVKVAPLLIPRRILEEAERRCQMDGPVIEVRPFRRLRVALIATDRLHERALARARANLGAKLAWYGATLEPLLPTAAEVAAVSAALWQAIREGAQLLLVAGGVSTDPADALFEGLQAAGGAVEQVGVPVDPGTACWIGHLGEVPVLGLASCELFGRITAFDLILPRLLAGEPLSPATLRQLAWGGLLEGGPPRVPDYGPISDGQGEALPAADETAR